jgi:hypothetical protein
VHVSVYVAWIHARFSLNCPASKTTRNIVASSACW